MCVLYVCVCVFMATIQYTVSKLWGGGVPTSVSGYSWPRLCASPQYIFNIPYAKYVCQRREKKSIDNGYMYGHQCGKSYFPNNLGTIYL